MLIAPRITAMGDGYLLPPPNSKRQTINRRLPSFEKDSDIKLAEGHSVVYIKIHSDTEIEVINRFQLRHFSVARGAARWDFLSETGELTEGSFQSATLSPRLSTKLLLPIVLLQSKTGLRATFRFRLDPPYRVMSVPKFRELINDVR